MVEVSLLLCPNKYLLVENAHLFAPRCCHDNSLLFTTQGMWEIFVSLLLKYTAMTTHKYSCSIMECQRKRSGVLGELECVLCCCVCSFSVYPVWGGFVMLVYRVKNSFLLNASLAYLYFTQCLCFTSINLFSLYDGLYVNLLDLVLSFWSCIKIVVNYNPSNGSCICRLKLDLSISEQS